MFDRHPPAALRTPCRDRRRTAAVFAAITVATAIAFGANPPPKIVLTPEQAKDLFGSKKAKLVMAYGGGLGAAQPQYGIVLTDPTPEWFFLCGDGNYGVFSPDGTRVAYPAAGNKICVRRFAKDGPDLQVIGAGQKPSWWIHPQTGDEYLIWAGRWGNDNNISGKTFIRKMKKGTCAPDGDMKVLIPNYNLGEGRSPDGQWICGVQPGCALAKFKDPLAMENAVVEIVWSQKRCCNGCISPDPKLSGIFHYEDVLHNRISFSPGEFSPGKVQLEDIPPPPPHRKIMWVRWSNDPDYITGAPSLQDDYERPWTHEGFIYQRSKKRWVKYATGAGGTHLWVGGGEFGKVTDGLQLRVLTNQVAVLAKAETYKPLLDQCEQFAATSKDEPRVADAKQIVEHVKAYGRSGLTHAESLESRDLRKAMGLYGTLQQRFAGLETGEAASRRIRELKERGEDRAWVIYEYILTNEKGLKDVPGTARNVKDAKWAAANQLKLSTIKGYAATLKKMYPNTQATQRATEVLAAYGL